MVVVLNLAGLVLVVPGAVAVVLGVLAFFGVGGGLAAGAGDAGAVGLLFGLGAVVVWGGVAACAGGLLLLGLAAVLVRLDQHRVQNVARYDQLAAVTRRLDRLVALADAVEGRPPRG